MVTTQMEGLRETHKNGMIAKQRLFIKKILFIYF